MNIFSLLKSEGISHLLSVKIIFTFFTSLLLLCTKGISQTTDSQDKAKIKIQITIPSCACINTDIDESVPQEIKTWLSEVNRSLLQGEANDPTMKEFNRIVEESAQYDVVLSSSQLAQPKISRELGKN